MKPYPRNQSSGDRSKAIFNYRLSRARRIVENAFGLLTQSFRIFLTPIHLNIETTEILVTVACILHNLIIEEKLVSTKMVSEHDCSSDLPSIEANDNDPEIFTDESVQIRNNFREYFNNVGAVAWQNESFRL